MTESVNWDECQVKLAPQCYLHQLKSVWLFNLPLIALTAHFKYHRSFDHEHSLPLVGLGLITLIETRILNNKNGKIKKINLSFLMAFFHVIVITIHSNPKCI